MTPIETIEYRGENIEIYQDENADNPRSCDNLGTMACWHRRYNLGDERPKSSPLEYLAGIAEMDEVLYDEDSEKVSMDKVLAKLESEMVIIPLYLYDRSGVTMNTTGFSCKWGSGQVGWVYCTLEDARKNWQLHDAQWDTKLDGEWAAGRTLRQCTEDVLRGEVETYDQYLRGDVYGWMAGDDSCWGYFGSDHKESGLLAAAQDAIDHKLSKMKTFVCSNCGGKNVLRDATAEWCDETQEWEMVAVQDNAYCEDCQSETSLEERRLHE